MNEKTVYFTDYKSLFLIDKNIYEPYAISLTKPQWYKGKRIRELRPLYAMMRFYDSIDNPDDKDREMYLNSYYRDVLSELNLDELFDKLQCDKKILLVTYERYNEFGHAIAIKRWLIENGYECISLFKQNNKKHRPRK